MPKISPEATKLTETLGQKTMPLALEPVSWQPIPLVPVFYKIGGYLFNLDTVSHVDNLTDKEKCLIKFKDGRKWEVDVKHFKEISKKLGL